MAIEVVWDDQLPNLICYRFPARWTWEDYLTASQQESALAQTINNERYDVIGDFLQSPYLPTGSGISLVYSAFKKSRHQRGLVVVVTTQLLIRTMVEIGTKAYAETRNSFATTNNLKQAYTIIENSRIKAHQEIKAL